MPRPKQTEEQMTAMRTRILDAAAELLNDEGPENAIHIVSAADGLRLGAGMTQALSPE